MCLLKYMSWLYFVILVRVFIKIHTSCKQAAKSTHCSIAQAFIAWQCYVPKSYVLSQIPSNRDVSYSAVYWPQSAVGSKSDYRSSGRKLDPSPVPYFCSDQPRNNFYGHSPPSADSRRVFVRYLFTGT